MYAIVRIRGTANISKDKEDTLKMLNLPRINTCTIVPDTPQYLGMMRKVKDYVAFGPIKKETIDELVKKKGLKDDKQVFRLNPPRKGFRSVRLSFPKGDLGLRREGMDELLKRMI
ncbi:MAG: uL30 family ribosomal protein [Candidatus Aenigmarchaeota archaeon]|nr:uL30 family ribosomal protein [Candidatus Aenigmarchaeota archaeon]